MKKLYRYLLQVLGHIMFATGAGTTIGVLNAEKN